MKNTQRVVTMPKVLMEKAELSVGDRLCWLDKKASFLLTTDNVPEYVPCSQLYDHSSSVRLTIPKKVAHDWVDQKIVFELIDGTIYVEK